MSSPGSTGRSSHPSTLNFALRLGLRQIEGLREDDAKRLVAIHASLPAKAYSDVRDLWRRSGLKRASLERLAAADSFRSLGLDRRQALWEVRGLPLEIPLPLFDHTGTAEAGAEQEVALPVMPLSEHVVNDYRTLRLSLKAHPMSFLRARIAAMRIAACADLKRCRDGARVSVAGVVLVRQRPGSAQGVVFMTIEDETGIANSVIWPNVLERERKAVMGARLVVVHGRIQRHEDIIHVVAARLEDRSDWLHLLTEEGEALSLALANADALRPPEPGSWRPPSQERFHPRWHPRRHPRAERIIPKSRDFH
jgi:error-prone DNA polymerase